MYNMPDIQLRRYFPPQTAYMMFSDMLGPIHQYIVLWGFLASLVDQQMMMRGLPEVGMVEGGIYVYDHDGQTRAITFRNGHAFACLPEITGQLLTLPQNALQANAN